ncbi:hypothetical protein CLAIMM_08998 [Cladophialophora immunda]|nr:hypothetical protein CLAIMM_08998 [Cladophialophora immunda]
MSNVQCPMSDAESVLFRDGQELRTQLAVARLRCIISRYRHINTLDTIPYGPTFPRGVGLGSEEKGNADKAMSFGMPNGAKSYFPMASMSVVRSFVSSSHHLRGYEAEIPPRTPSDTSPPAVLPPYYP